MRFDWNIKFIYQSILTAWITWKAGLSAVTLLESANSEDRSEIQGGETGSRINRKEIAPIGSGDPGDLNHKEPSLLVGRDLPCGLQREAGEQFSSNIHFPLLSCAELGAKHGSLGPLHPQQ